MQLSVSIIEQPNVIDDHLLDIIGNEFKFSHEKGLPEWLKNSVDAYIRLDPPVSDDEQFINLNFRDASGGEAPIFECIDFCGMTSDDIDKALKRWGDPKAASRGLKKRTYGGHGNGGKFYMRQMFERSYFLTYREGKLNVFGFNEKRKYGFARGLKDKLCQPREALKLAGLSEVELPAGIREKIEDGRTGFTVVRGIRPSRVTKVISVSRLSDKLKFHPQARKLIQRKPVRILHNGRVFLERLEPERIEIRPGYENLSPIAIPASLPSPDDEAPIEFANENYAAGCLRLAVAKDPFGRNSRLAELNCIDILGEIGVIASYRIHELVHITQYAQAEFILGECSCPILEDPNDDCVKNDREKLIAENPKTKALLKWIAEQIDALGRRLEEEETKERKLQNLRLTDEFNKILNTWKNQFMDRMLTDVLGGKGIGTSSGGLDGNGSGGGAHHDSETKGGRGGEGGAGGSGGDGSESRKGSRHPIVLLSSYNPDPFDDQDTLHLSPRHNPVYQRPKDVQGAVYWINTSRPLATEILKRYGAESPRWREYHFQRFVDIIVMEALHVMEKRGMELTFDLVENKINEVIKAVHDNALQSLGQYLL